MSAQSPRRRARWVGCAVLMLAALLLVVNSVQLSRNWRQLRPISPGDEAPGFSLVRIDGARSSDGERVDLAALRGQVVLIDFWAEWCRPCRQAMPAIESVYRRYRANGMAVVSIKTDGGFGERGREIEQATSFPIVGDDAGVARRYKVTTIPHLVLVDHRGIVRYVHRGFGGAASLRRELSEQVAALLGRRGLR